MEGSKSINSLTTSKLVSMVKSSFKIFRIFSSCKTKMNIFCNDSFFPYNCEQNVQKHKSRCSVSSFIRVLDGARLIFLFNMA